MRLFPISILLCRRVWVTPHMHKVFLIIHMVVLLNLSIKSSFNDFIVELVYFVLNLTFFSYNRVE